MILNKPTYQTEPIGNAPMRFGLSQGGLLNLGNPSFSSFPARLTARLFIGDRVCWQWEEIQFGEFAEVETFDGARSGTYDANPAFEVVTDKAAVDDVVMMRPGYFSVDHGQEWIFSCWCGANGPPPSFDRCPDCDDNEMPETLKLTITNKTGAFFSIPPSGHTPDFFDFPYMPFSFAWSVILSDDDCPGYAWQFILTCNTDEYEPRPGWENCCGLYFFALLFRRQGTCSVIARCITTTVTFSQCTPGDIRGHAQIDDNGEQLIQCTFPPVGDGDGFDFKIHWDV